jgi:hypothetical protein
MAGVDIFFQRAFYFFVFQTASTDHDRSTSSSREEKKPEKSQNGEVDYKKVGPELLKPFCEKVNYKRGGSVLKTFGREVDYKKV